jgi:hypothetical protein
MPVHRRVFLTLLGTVLSGSLVASPLRFSVEDGGLHLTYASASAKEGKGGGNGNGGGKGNGNGGGNGNGNGGGNGGGKGGGDGKDSEGKGVGTNAKSENGSSLQGGQDVNPATADRVDRTGLEVVHRNGMRERIYRGSYKMTDSKGRTIIERRATGADLARLRRLAG